MGYAGDGGHVASYYAATANPAPARPPLAGVVEADVGVVGAGYSGLSCALALAERGYRVVVLEGARVGWGASGRNGGQIVAGLNAGLDVVERRYGADTAAFVAGLVQEGGATIRDRVARYGIDCDLKDGNVFAGLTRAHLRAFEAKRELWARHGHGHLEMLDADGIRGHVASDLYAGGMLDPTGGHLHPLNLALGEAAALESLGGTIHEGSVVTGVETGARPVIRTAAGEVRCRAAVLCGNAYLGDVVPDLARRVMPVSTQVMATEPLGEALAARLLPRDTCIEDARYILDYYRLSADRRLLFGGGSVYGGADPRDIEARLRRNMDRVFPELGGIAVDHVWSGWFALSFSRVPQLGRLGPATYFAHGYSGHGLTGSHTFGAILAEAIHGDATRFDVFAGLPWIAFPGGRRLRVPYSAMGAWWYGLRDRLGV